jgi:dienelactone hydrolase
MVLKMMKEIAMLTGATMLIAGAASAQTIAPGNHEYSVELPETKLNVFTYRPADTAPKLVLIVFHGLNRDAGPYRDNARALADRIGAIVVAPEFDAPRFSTDLYQRGGVATKSGAIVPPGKRTVDLIQPLIDWARAASGQPSLPSALIGHSAGGQFLTRIAAYAATDATRIVIANPSTWVLPSTQDAVPYGFKGMTDSEALLRTYLELPITVLLGANDTGTHNLASEPEALAQGINRLERGRNTFEKARTAAQQHGWPFHWTSAEVPGVGHDSRKMFSSAQAIAAFDR